MPESWSLLFAVKHSKKNKNGDNNGENGGSNGTAGSDGTTQPQ